MKRLHFKIIFAILLIPFFSDAQRIQGMLIGGGNIAQVDGDEIYGFSKLGANIGLGAISPLNEHFEICLETVFTQKGSYQKEQYSQLDTAGTLFTGEYNLRLNYLEVPVLFHYKDKNVLTAGAGFSFARLISVSEYEHGRKIETTSLNTGPYERNDFSVIADLRFRIYQKFRLNFRYSYSLAKIRTRDFFTVSGKYLNSRDQFNNVLSIRILYLFNEAPPTADEKNRNSGF